MHPVIAHLPRLRRYANALVRDKWGAEDLLQDTLERAYSKWHLWRSDSNLRAWLFSIMHNVFINQITREAARPARVPLEEALEVSVAARNETQMEARDLIKALEKLPDEQREVVLLICLEDMKYEEAARVLDIPVGTVMSRLARGREKLRRLMEGAPNETSNNNLKVVK